MAVHINTIADTDALIAIGSPTIGASDVINLVEGTTSYTTNLGALGTTQFTRFVAGPGYSGNIGDYPLGLLVVAQEISIESMSRLVALEGDDNALTVTGLFTWKNKVGGRCTLDKYKDLTRADLISSGSVNFLASTNVDNAYVKAGGLTADFEKGGDALVLLEVGVPDGGSGTAKADVGRDAATINIKSRGEVYTHDDCSPTTVNIDAGTLRHAGGDITNINAGGGVLDFSRLPASIATIAWTITGDITIIRPANGITIDEPDSTQQGSFRVTYMDAA